MPSKSNRQDNTYDLALTFLLLRFRRRTRFFLHLALIFADGSRLRVWLLTLFSYHGAQHRESSIRKNLHFFEDEEMVARVMVKRKLSFALNVCGC
jgi:hypothetical protein